MALVGSFVANSHPACYVPLDACHVPPPLQNPLSPAPYFYSQSLCAQDSNVSVFPRAMRCVSHRRQLNLSGFVIFFASIFAPQAAARDVETQRPTREVGGTDRIVLGDDTLPFPQQSMLQEDMALTYHPVLQEHADRTIAHGVTESADCPLFSYVLIHAVETIAIIFVVLTCGR